MPWADEVRGKTSEAVIRVTRATSFRPHLETTSQFALLFETWSNKNDLHYWPSHLVFHAKTTSQA